MGNKNNKLIKTGETRLKTKTKTQQSKTFNSEQDFDVAASPQAASEI